MNTPPALLSSQAPASPIWRLRSFGARLAVRLALVMLALLLLVQVGNYFVFQQGLTHQERQHQAEQLRLGQQQLQQLLAQRTAQLQRLGQEALAAGHAEPVAVFSRLGEPGLWSQAVLLNSQFKVLASHTPLSSARRDWAAAAARLAPRTSQAGVAQAFDVAWLDDQAQQVVMLALPGAPAALPTTTPPTTPPTTLPVRWLLLSAPIDDSLNQALQQLAGVTLHLMVTQGPVSRAARGGTATWRSATPLLAPDWLRASASNLGSGSNNPQFLTHGEQRIAWQALRLNASATEVGAGAASFATVPTSPLPHALAAPALLAVLSLPQFQSPAGGSLWQAVLLGLTVLGMVAAVAMAVFSARRINAPLPALTAAAQRLGRGEGNLPLNAAGQAQHEEMSEFTLAFEQMRQQVAQRQDQVQQLAYWDHLTGLPNRVQSRHAADNAIEAARHGGHAVALLLIDLDRFKHINDVLGHHVGDLLLQQVAQRLVQHVVRDGDLVSRSGGSEFAVLLRPGDVLLGLAVAQRLKQAFEAPLLVSEHTIQMDVHIGMACFPDHAQDAAELHSCAAVALYAAKRVGVAKQTTIASGIAPHSNLAPGYSAMVYDPAMDTSSAHTLKLLTELKRALDQGQLCLYLQPRVALDSGAVAGAQALLRWQHPQQGLLLPEAFMPVAEETGLARALSLWSFEESARIWQSLHSEGMTLPLSVKLCNGDLLDIALPLKLDSLLVKHRAPAEAFCLQVSEAALMADPLRSQATLHGLAELGFKIAIDDFGSGHSSMSALKNLPVDELQMPAALVQNMRSDLDDAKIVRATIDLAHNLGLAVVADGIETAQAWDLLRDLSCDAAQGQHLGPPMPASEFKLWCGTWATRQRPSDRFSSLMLH